MENNSQRLQSLDALRGFDMLFIMGGGAFFIALAQLFPTPFFQALAEQMEHVEWAGLRIEDMIFPTFLFIAGISFPYSLSKQREHLSTKAIYRKTLHRGLMLVFLGVIYNGLLNFDFEHLRIASVLARIGLGWMFAALIYMNTSRKMSALISVAILIFYWLVAAFIPAPDGNGADVFSPEGSFIAYLDRCFLPGVLYNGNFDPEGLFSTIPAVSTALFGMLTGALVKYPYKDWTPSKKVQVLVLTGVALIVVGYVWSFAFPIIKKMWTSTFVCVVGGISMLLFALFYYIVDVRNCRKWTFFFRVIGMNSITIYLAQEFISFSFTSERLFGGIIGLFPETAQPLIGAIGYIALCWLFLYFLYRQKIFLKV